jgi:hypothetical protein
LTEYRPGFQECRDCGLPLMAGSPPKLGAAPRAGVNDNLDLVAVLETEDPFALQLAKASLENAGIPYLVRGDEPGNRPAVHATGSLLSGCSCVIQVAREHEAEARELLDPLRNPDLAIELEADLEEDMNASEDN